MQHLSIIYIIICITSLHAYTNVSSFLDDNTITKRMNNCFQMTKWKALSASSNKASQCLKPSKDAMTAGLNFITNKIEECKANSNGKMPHGTLVKIVSQNLVAFPWLNIDRVNYFM